MARQGTDVHYSFTCQPVCGPARSCMQTGMYATETGCYRNGIALPEDSKTLAHYFNDAGTTRLTSANGTWRTKARVRSRPSSAADTKAG